MVMNNILVRNYLFGFIFATMIFCDLPFRTPLPYGRSFTSILLIIAFNYAIYAYRKKIYEYFFACKTQFFVWAVGYLGICILSLVWGLATFPYTEMFFFPPNQLEQSFLVKHLANMGIYLSDGGLIPFVMFRGIKDILIYFVFTFGASYLLYCYYYRDFASLKKVFVYGFFFSLAVIMGYSIIELFYQAGNETAKNILKQTYPWFMHMQKEPIPWPPLLWQNQLRSVFLEPSYIGNYAAIAIPVLWGGIIQAASVRSKAGFAFLTFFYTFIIFLSQSRAAYAILLGLLFLCGVLVLWLKRFRRSAALIGALTAVSFACACFFMLGFSKHDYRKRSNVSSVIVSNVASLADAVEWINGDVKEKKEEVRSPARYVMIRNYCKMGLERPILGVGDFQPFAAVYAMHNLTDTDKKDREIKLWLSVQEKYGVLKAGVFVATSKYADRFGKAGILGLGLYLIPFLYALYRLLSVLYNAKIHPATIYDSDLCGAFVMFLMICGIIASGMNGNHEKFFWNFAALGAAYVFLSEHNIWRTGLYKPGNEV